MMSSTPPGRRWGTRRDVARLLGISVPTLDRIERTDANAPKPRRLPTGGVVRDLRAWAEYFERLPVILGPIRGQR